MVADCLEALACNPGLEQIYTHDIPDCNTCDACEPRFHTLRHATVSSHSKEKLLEALESNPFLYHLTVSMLNASTARDVQSNWMLLTYSITALLFKQF
jgi:hypothetical protein